MRILIIEDEAPAFRRLQKMLEELNPAIEIIEVLDSVEESVEWFQQNGHPDIIFMDIQLSDGISFDIFDQVTINAPVIFTTAYDDYMLRAFKVNSIDYLLKPIKAEDLAFSFKKFEDLRRLHADDKAYDLGAIIKQIKLKDRAYKSRFLSKQGEKLLSIEAADIAYFQTRNGVVFLTTHSDKRYMIDASLDELSQQLDPEEFYRANRQFVVHFSAIKTVHKYYNGKLLVELIKPADEKITVSSEKSSGFKAWLGN